MPEFKGKTSGIGTWREEDTKRALRIIIKVNWFSSNTAVKASSFVSVVNASKIRSDRQYDAIQIIYIYQHTHTKFKSKPTNAQDY